MKRPRTHRPPLQLDAFSANPADLPLFSGTAARAQVSEYNPQPVTMQVSLFACPPLPAPTEPAPFDTEKAYLMTEYLWTVPVFYDDREAIDHLINRFNCNYSEARFAVRLGPDPDTQP